MDRFRPPDDEIDCCRWFGSDARIQPYWGSLIRVRLAADGLPCDTEGVRRYQTDELAAPHGDTCLLDLLPLPSPSTRHWTYGDHSDLAVLRDRETYRAEIAPRRVDSLRALIALHRPRYVVFAGLSYLGYWNDVAGQPLPPAERSR